MAGTTRTLYLAIFSAVLGMLQYGFGIGVINAPQTLIQDFIKQSFKSRYGTDLDASKAKFWFSLAVNGAIVGGLLGAISGGSMANKFGRKRGLLIAQGPSLVGSILMGISKTTNSFELLLIGRTLFGISCGWFTALAPMYVSEIAPVNIRGAMGTINQLSVTGGILISMVLGLSEVLGTNDAWPILLALSAVPAIVQLVLLPAMPESPTFLISVKKDMVAGKSAIERLSGYKGDKIDEMAESLVEGDTAQSMSIFSLLMNRSLHLSLFVCICLHLSQQLSGMVAIFYYSTTFFQSAGLNITTSQYATIGVGAIMVTMTFITIPLMDRLGRRILHLVGLAGIIACSIAITVALTLQSSDKDNRNLGVFLVAATLIFVAFFAFGPGSIPWMAAGEMFTQEARGPATSVCVFVNWLGNLTVGLVFPLLQDTINTYSFVPFLAITTVLFFVLLVYFPETKGISPNQLQATLSSNGAWRRAVGLRASSALLSAANSQQDNLQTSYGTLNSEIEAPKNSHVVTNI